VDATHLLDYGAITLLLLVGVLFLAGCLAGTTGVGFAQLASVFLALLLDTRLAVILLSGVTPLIMLLPIIRYRYLARPAWQRLRPMFLTTPVGVLLGVWLLVRLPTAALALGLGVLTVLSVLATLRRGRVVLPVRWERWASPLVGIVAAAANSAVGVAGPVVVAYFLALDLPPRMFAFSASAVFVAVGIMRLLTLLAVGEVTVSTAALSLALCVPAALGMRAGFWLEERLDARRFQALMLGVLLLTGLQLIYRGAADLWPR
jgi:uncharacterized membrane protein YfcA